MGKKDKKKNYVAPVFVRPYHRIMISRKILGFWLEFPMVDRMDNDPEEFFNQTRDHYSRQWGAKNVRLRLYWQDDLYNGEGKRLK